MKLLLLCIVLFLSQQAIFAQQNRTFYSIEEGLENPTAVDSLYIISDRDIDFFLDSIKQFVNLKQLTFNPNSRLMIGEIPLPPNLEELYFIKTEIGDIFLESNPLKKLKKLVIVNSSIDSFPEGICQLKQLTHLEITFTDIMEIPSSIGQLKTLQYLDLSSNRLKGEFLGLGKLKQLKHLDLSRNSISFFPSEINKLTALEKLDLSANKLTGIPLISPRLKVLSSIDLSYTKIKDFPITLLYLKGLKKLNLSRNKMEFPTSFGIQKSPLQSLDLYNCQLTSFPVVLTELKYLENLKIRYNKLMELPKAIEKFEALKVLDVSKCHLHKIAEGIEFGPSLKELYLQFNDLESLPSSIEGWRSLKRLEVAFCYIKYLPEGLGKLDSLEVADFKYNQLQTIPEAIKKQLSNRLISVGNPLTEDIKKTKEMIEATKRRVVDERDGQLYEAITIGSSTWMTTHLNFETKKSILDTVLKDNGRLYRLSEYDKVCPVGWHTATTQDWRTLIAFIYQHFEQDPNAEDNKQSLKRRRIVRTNRADRHLAFDLVIRDKFGEVGVYFVNKDFAKMLEEEPNVNFLGLNIRHRLAHTALHSRYAAVYFPCLDEKEKWKSFMLESMGPHHNAKMIMNHSPSQKKYYPVRCVASK